MSFLCLQNFNPHFLSCDEILDPVSYNWVYYKQNMRVNINTGRMRNALGYKLLSPLIVRIVNIGMNWVFALKMGGHSIKIHMGYDTVRVFFFALI